MFTINEITITDSTSISEEDYKKQLELDENNLKEEMVKYHKECNLLDDLTLEEKQVKDISCEDYLKKLFVDKEKEEKVRLERERQSKVIKSYNRFFDEVKYLDKV